jgi:hypothetical protein
MAKLSAIEGVGDTYAGKLSEAGITSTDVLLTKGADPGGRKELAEKTGISEKLILKWVNQVDLARIKGISEEYGELLEVAGVDSVPELSLRNPENLYNNLVTVNEKKHLVRKLPAQRQVSQWIEEAKSLPRVVTH